MYSSKNHHQSKDLCCIETTMHIAFSIKIKAQLITLNTQNYNFDMEKCDLDAILLHMNWYMHMEQ